MGGFPWDTIRHELNKVVVNESNPPAFSPTGAVFLRP